MILFFRSFFRSFQWFPQTISNTYPISFLSLHSVLLPLSYRPDDSVVKPAQFNDNPFNLKRFIPFADEQKLLQSAKNQQLKQREEQARFVNVVQRSLEKKKE